MGIDFYLYRLRKDKQKVELAKPDCDNRDHVFMEVCEAVDLLLGKVNAGMELWIWVSDDFNLDIESGYKVEIPNHSDCSLAFNDILKIQNKKVQESWDIVTSSRLFDKIAEIKKEELHTKVIEAAKVERDRVCYLLDRDFNDGEWFELFREQFIKIISTIKDGYIFYYSR